MAVKSKKKRKPKRPFQELTIWGAILSYPDLHNPKPFKGKTYFQSDVLLDADHPDLAKLKKAITKVRTAYWGEDKSEWVKPDKPLIQNGDKREDQKGYAGKFFITPKSQFPVDVVNKKGKPFDPQMVRGGMFANVAVRVAAWENEGDQGVSIYLQGIMIDTDKKALNFGGGRSVKQMFNLGRDDDDMDESDDDDDDEPRGKKKKGFSFDDDEDDDSEEE